MILWLLPLALLLYPCPLWEPPVPTPPPSKGSPPTSSKATPAVKQDLGLRGFADLNRQAFLLSFERQAGAKLMPCLRDQAGETGTVLFMGRLSRSGRISGVRVLRANIDCAVAAVEEMGFQSVTQGMKNESLEISWRFDW